MRFEASGKALKNLEYQEWTALIFEECFEELNQ
jgi:hypothetical protein